jgi:threonine dehydrogenase-like Zn-dependent dehydrogenase
LGVGIHGVTLGKVGIGMSVVIFGGGPIGLCLLQASLLAGAAKVFVVDPLPWRVALAEKLGGVGIAADPTASVELIKSQTGGRGVHVAFEAAWAGETIGQAIETVMPGGRVVLVGIPAQRDEITVVHSSARAKALTLLFLRRTRLNFPAALAVIQASKVTLLPLITHRFDLENAPAAFELNSNYRDSVVKVIIGVK